jgi:hypothetical protein
LVILHVAGTLGPENLTYGEAASQPQPEGYQQRLWEDFQRRVPLPPGLEEVELYLAVTQPNR